MSSVSVADVAQSEYLFGNNISVRAQYSGINKARSFMQPDKTGRIRLMVKKGTG